MNDEFSIKGKILIKKDNPKIGEGRLLITLEDIKEYMTVGDYEFHIRNIVSNGIDGSPREVLIYTKSRTSGAGDLKVLNDNNSILLEGVRIYLNKIIKTGTEGGGMTARVMCVGPKSVRISRGRYEN